MEELLFNFINSLRYSNGYSQNTAESYLRDISRFIAYLKDNDIDSFEDVSKDDMYDYIIVMDNNNLRNLRYIIGEDTQHKVHKMMAFAGEMRDVKDPWYTNNFDETYADIDKGCRALLDYLRDNGNI